MEIEIPFAYILNRDTTPEVAEVISDYLAFTPVFCSLIHNREDVRLAAMFAPEVRVTASESESLFLASEIFKERDLPCLVVGTTEHFDAVYPGGRREEVSFER
jgi:hypothetical protein